MLQILACGDALFSSRNLARRLDPRLVAALQGADAAFANAEFCCPRPATPPAPRRWTTAARPEVLDEFVELNIPLLSFANNHTGDFGPQGVLDTLEAAEARGLIAGGVGRSLYEARAARFLDTANGRIGLVTACTTRAAIFTASAPGTGVVARPGLNPLRFGRAYVLPEREFGQLREIDRMLGTAASRDEVARVEVMKPVPDTRFPFGSVFEGSLQIELGDAPGVRYFVNERDRDAILANVRDAAARSDCVLMSLHTHEGEVENWYAPRPASFIEAFAHQAVDAGASAVLCHGAHMLRGVEVYRGKPIFYSLNSLLMEFEAGEQVMTPEMYDGFGFPPDALPSHIHGSRVQDAAGNRIGFYGDPRFSRSMVAACEFLDGEVKVRLLPVDLDLNRARPAERGVPYWPTPDVARAIADDVAQLSRYWGTTIEYQEKSGEILVRGS